MLFKSPTSEPGRFFAKDPCVIRFHGRGFLYYSRQRIEETGYDCFVIGIAVSDDLENWEEAGEILPEQECIEAPAALFRDGKMYLFYAGAYNCSPQQIGCAVSRDGIRFTRLQDTPLLKNGAEGEWNASESGHPYVFEDEDGKVYLFYQGSPDGGKNWFLSRAEVLFDEAGNPRIEA